MGEVEWLKYLWAPIVAVLGYFVKKRDDEMVALKREIKETAKDVDDHKLHVSENYVKNREMIAVVGSMNRMEDRLNKIYDHLVTRNHNTRQGESHGLD